MAAVVVVVVAVVVVVEAVVAAYSAEVLVAERAAWLEPVAWVAERLEA